MGRHKLCKDEGAALVALLRACTRNKDLCRGTQVHDDILRRGLLRRCSDALVTMYAKCGALVKARELFGLHNSRNMFTWNTLIAGHAHKGQDHVALNYLERMQREGLSPDAVTFTCILKACANIGALGKGEQIHDEIAQQDLLENNIVLGNALINMYAKCGALAKARQVLEELPVRNVISWSSLIAGYAKYGKAEQALHCFEDMQLEGIFPDEVTFTCILKACGSIKAADMGEKIHDEISKHGLLRNNIVLGTALVDMYSKCGALVKAHWVLEQLPIRDIFAWSALIAGYAQHGKCEQALNCFEGMLHEGLSPDAVTFICLLKACGNVGAADKGEKIHYEIAKQGLLANNTVLGTAVVDMYAKCGALAKARRALEDLPTRNVVSWNALITGHVQQGEGVQALSCFEAMRREGIVPDVVTFMCILKACGSIGAIDEGEKIHDVVSKQGLLGKNIALGTALVDMYAKCGALARAKQVLEELPVQDVVSWNALIAGYVEQGEGVQALNHFEQMQRKGLSPDKVTYLCMFKACGSVGAADKGEKIHDEVVEQGLLENDIVLGTAVVDMYAKCGALAKARAMLEDLPVRNVVSWNALIAGSIQKGEGEQALSCFEQMKHEGLSPDAVTFSCVLSACSRLGLIADAQICFTDLITKHGMMPGLEHYTGMVDLFGRAGHLDKAVEVIEKMPSPSSVVCSTLLGACRKWGDVNVGRWAFGHAVQADKSDATAYVHMANIYAAAGMQTDADYIEAMTREKLMVQEVSGYAG